MANESAWTPSEVDLLINLVRENPGIYDQSCPGYSNLLITENLWRSIGTYFPNRNEQQLRKKWQILRTGYRTRRGCRYASGSGAKQPKQWAYFESLQFLEKYLTERATTGNVSEINRKRAINSAAPSTPSNINLTEINSAASSISSSINLSSLYENDIPEEIEVIQLDDSEAQFSPAPHTSGMANSSDLGEPHTPGGDLDEPHTPEGVKGVKRKRHHLSLVDEKFIAYLEAKRTPKKQKSSNELFLASLLEDMNKLSPAKTRTFKFDMLNRLNELLY